MASEREQNKKMGKAGKHLQNTSHEIKELQDYKHELYNWLIDLQNQINMKD
jgi:flagellar biosynthesis chaperone FliJ